MTDARINKVDRRTFFKGVAGLMVPAALGLQVDPEPIKRYWALDQTMVRRPLSAWDGGTPGIYGDMGGGRITYPLPDWWSNADNAADFPDAEYDGEHIHIYGMDAWWGGNIEKFSDGKWYRVDKVNGWGDRVRLDPPLLMDQFS